MSDQVREPVEPTRVEVTDPVHCSRLGRWFALQEMSAVLHDSPVRLPGVGYAMALVDKALAEVRVECIQRNLRAARDSGVDLNALAEMDIEGLTLICHHEEPEGTT
jgi:hypothetical protein